jgi:putative transcriptional regulator
MENKIESLRSTHAWTQQELADRVGVSRQTIISLENGRYNPSILLAFRLSKLFNKPIESIFIFNAEEF